MARVQGSAALGGTNTPIPACRTRRNQGANARQLAAAVVAHREVLPPSRAARRRAERRNGRRTPAQAFDHHLAGAEVPNSTSSARPRADEPGQAARDRPQVGDAVQRREVGEGAVERLARSARAPRARPPANLPPTAGAPGELRCRPRRPSPATRRSAAPAAGRANHAASVPVPPPISSTVEPAGRPQQFADARPGAARPRSATRRSVRRTRRRRVERRRPAEAELEAARSRPAASPAAGDGQRRAVRSDRFHASAVGAPVRPRRAARRAPGGRTPVSNVPWNSIASSSVSLPVALRPSSRATAVVELGPGERIGDRHADVVGRFVADEVAGRDDVLPSSAG